MSQIEQAEGPPMERPSGLTKPDLSRQPLTVTWNVPTQELAHQAAALMEQSDRIANYVAGLPNREDHEAVVGDVTALQQQMGLVFKAVQGLTRTTELHTQSIRDLLDAIQLRGVA